MMSTWQEVRNSNCRRTNLLTVGAEYKIEHEREGAEVEIKFLIKKRIVILLRI